jgi:hypothetical protein
MGSGTLGFREMLYKKSTLNLCKNGIIASKKKTLNRSQYLNTMASKNPTSGFRLTHVGLRVTDINRSVAFYTSVFGMKELGRMGLDTTTVVFLGYPDAADPQTQLFAREGVLELVCPKVNDTSSKKLVRFRQVIG